MQEVHGPEALHRDFADNHTGNPAAMVNAPWQIRPIEFDWIDVGFFAKTSSSPRHLI